jgi:hypothetical protein
MCIRPSGTTCGPRIGYAYADRPETRGAHQRRPRHVGHLSVANILPSVAACDELGVFTLLEAEPLSRADVATRLNLAEDWVKCCSAYSVPCSSSACRTAAST